jgi:hypothetical protein
MRNGVIIFITGQKSGYGSIEISGVGRIVVVAPLDKRIP